MNNVNKLEKYIENNIPVYLYGTPGTGKTETIIKIADKLGKEIVTQSVSPLATKGEFFGFMSIDGKSYVRTVFREAYEKGKVFLLDEMDLLSPSLSPVLNQSLSQDWLTFPDGIVKKHRNFLFCGTGNTNGKPKEGFSGRQPIDNSFIDRFLCIEWFLDEQLERDISPNYAFTLLVQEIRKKSIELGINLQVTMRSAILGGKALQTYAEKTEKDILDLLDISVFKGKIDKNSKDKILNSEYIKNIIKSLIEENTEKSELEEIEESEYERESEIKKVETLKFSIKILSPTPENLEKYRLENYFLCTLDDSKFQEKNSLSHFSGEITKNKILHFMGRDREEYKICFFTYTKEKKQIIESQLKKEKLI